MTSLAILVIFFFVLTLAGIGVVNIKVDRIMKHFDIEDKD